MKNKSFRSNLIVDGDCEVYEDGLSHQLEFSNSSGCRIHRGFTWSFAPLKLILTRVTEDGICLTSGIDANVFEKSIFDDIGSDLICPEY